MQGGSRVDRRLKLKPIFFFLKRCFEAAGVDTDFQQVEQSQVYLLSSSTPVFEHVSRGEAHVPVVEMEQIHRSCVWHADQPLVEPVPQRADTALVSCTCSSAIKVKWTI